MEIGYKNLFFFIPRLTVISLNLAFQPPFLAPQSDKYLETTKEKGCWVKTFQNILFSPKASHCSSITEANPILSSLYV